MNCSALVYKQNLVKETCSTVVNYTWKTSALVSALLKIRHVTAAARWNIKPERCNQSNKSPFPLICGNSAWHTPATVES